MASQTRYRRVWRGRNLAQLRAVERHSFNLLQEYAKRVTAMTIPNYQDATKDALNAVVAQIAIEIGRKVAV
jgi:hypothetical protein